MISGKDTFAKMTQEIAEYAGQEFEFRTGMVNMRLPTLVEPSAPMDDTPISFELWKMAQRNFEKQTKACHQNSSRVYGLVIAQCSQALRNWMEAIDTWNHINKSSNIMELLQLIQNCMIQRQTQQKPIHSLLNTEMQVYSFKQKGLVNNKYYEKFKDLVMNAK